MGRRVNRAVANFLRHGGFSPKAMALASPTARADHFRNEALEAAHALFKPKVRVIDAEPIKASELKEVEEDDIEGPSNMEGNRKAALVKDDSILFGKDIWSFHRGRVSWMRSDYAKTSSWKLTRRRQYR